MIEDFSRFRQPGFTGRHLLSISECTKEKYTNCFEKCPPKIPPPPPPPTQLLESYNPPWCMARDSNWTCVDSFNGPIINGKNPRLHKGGVTEDDNMVPIITGVLIPLIIIIVIVVLLVLFIRRRKSKKTPVVDNTYNLGNLVKQTAPVWTDHEQHEGAGEDGSEIFYQVDRSALNAGLGMNSIPDVVFSSNAHAQSISRQDSRSPDALYHPAGRSGSAASNTPLLTTPPEGRRKRRATGGDVVETGGDDQSMVGTLNHPGTKDYPSYSHPYNTYSPMNSRSHPSLVKKSSVDSNRLPGGRTPENKPRPLRKQSQSSINRSDSATLNRTPKPGGDNYKDNWENFEEVTATMRKKRAKNKELVLGTDSFVDSYNSPDEEEDAGIDQLGLPSRNPFLAGFYDDQEPPSLSFDESSDPFSPDPSESPRQPPPYDRHISMDPQNGTPQNRKKRPSGGSRRDSTSSNRSTPQPDGHRRQPSAISECDSEASVAV